jgi:transposase
MTKDELVRQIRLAQAGGRRARYTPALRTAVLQYASERRASRVSWRDISKELGVAAGLVQRWMSTGQSRLVAVKVLARPPAPNPAHGGLVVHGPRGIRIEGLSASELADLIARLGA